MVSLLVIGVPGGPWGFLRTFLGGPWGSQDVHGASLGVPSESSESPWRSLGGPWASLGESWESLGASRDPWGTSGRPKDDPWASLAAFKSLKNSLVFGCFQQLAGLGNTLGAFSELAGEWGSLVDSGGSVGVPGRFLPVPGRHCGSIRDAFG